MYQRLAGSTRRNIWLVGDLHGCFCFINVSVAQAEI